MKAALLSYLLAYPANTANTLLQLLLHGEDIAFVHNKFQKSMEPHGLKGAVDIFINTIRSDTNISRLAVTCLQTPTTGLPYVGITNTVPCAKHATDNIAQDAPVTFVNFLSSMPTLAYSVNHILCLNTPTTASSDLRTNPVIGDKEHILHAVLGGSALNSAPGGGKLIFQPTAEMTAILDHLTALLPPLDFLLSQERDEALEQRCWSV
ncbi:hypothetical protein B0H14DRAFT_3524264 [Mycena olivaceomarginata]|nr:hypothetical protein B0H14DRAFT_3524264 [Mycena olivaceomarginata]